MKKRYSRWTENSVLLSPVLQNYYFFPKQSSSMCDDPLLSLLLRRCLPRFKYADVTLETVALDTSNNVTDSFWHRCSSQKRNNDLSLKLRQIFRFSSMSHGLPLNTITKASTWALQRVNKGKKSIQCYSYQLKFCHCSQNKLLLYFVHALYV
jgi:hypothetical protein